MKHSTQRFEFTGEFLHNGNLSIYENTDNLFSAGQKVKIVIEAVCGDCGLSSEGDSFIHYGHQLIDEKDIASVCSVMRSDYLTTGPKVEAFEHAVSSYVGAEYGVAVSSGTAALHCAMYALGISSGDEVIVPPVTFAATANCVCFMGAVPVFADVEPDTLLIDTEKIEDLITSRTKAIIGVDYAGQPCNWERLREIVDRYNLALVADSCHAIGALYKGHKVGTLADMTIFSFHPVKHITTGEGGMVVTDNEDYASRMRIFRNHGITSDAMQRAKLGQWFYEMTDLGYNYRISDIQCALGLSQLEKLSGWIIRRQEIAAHYDRYFADNVFVMPLSKKSEISHAYHLYVARVKFRDQMFSGLKAMGIGVNVHYIPVYLHPYYRQTFGYGKGLCPVAENAYKQLITLPLHHGMNNEDIMRVENGIKEIHKSLVG